MYVLMVLATHGGDDVNATDAELFQAKFGDLLKSEKAASILARTTEWVDAYGTAGAIAISVLPVILHPLVAVCLAGGKSVLEITTYILIGRTIKYIIMAEAAVSSPGVLKYFGATKAYEAASK
jgi:membrane protein YqaA with SNARE-associated domain